MLLHVLAAEFASEDVYAVRCEGTVVIAQLPSGELAACSAA